MFSRPKLFAILAGLDAAIRTADHYRTFDFEAADRGAIDELVLVRSTKRPTTASARSMSCSAVSTLEAVIPLSTELLDDGMYRIRPAELLRLGEFGSSVSRLVRTSPGA